MSMIPSAAEFHLSIRVADLAASTAFYAGFLGVPPKDRTPHELAGMPADKRPTFLVPGTETPAVPQQRNGAT